MLSGVIIKLEVFLLNKFKMKFYQYPKCSTCRKAAKFLKENNVDFTSIDIVETPPSKLELKTMLDSYDGDLRRLFNTSGVQYRELKMKDKLPKMTAAEAIELLSGNGKLIKRPFLLDNNKNGIVAFKETDWSEFLKA